MKIKEIVDAPINESYADIGNLSINAILSLISSNHGNEKELHLLRQLEQMWDKTDAVSKREVKGILKSKDFTKMLNKGLDLK